MRDALGVRLRLADQWLELGVEFFRAVRVEAVVNFPGID
jgi:hypothetical protein